jgi:CheY-like chemotaxis protein
MTERDKRRVLVVEDEALMAMLLEDMLHELGYEIAASAAKLDDALQLARTMSFDLALLDVNLNGERSFPVADVVRGRGLPVVFATGYGNSILVPPHLGTPLLQKPFSLEELHATLLKAGL